MLLAWHQCANAPCTLVVRCSRCARSARRRERARRQGRHTCGALLWPVQWVHFRAMDTNNLTDVCSSKYVAEMS